MTTQRTPKRQPARRQCVSGHVKTPQPLTFLDIEKRLKLIDEAWEALDKIEDVAIAMRSHALDKGSEGQRVYNRAEITKTCLTRTVHQHMEDLLVAACLCRPRNHHEAFIAVSIAGYAIYAAVTDSQEVDDKGFQRGIGILNGALDALQTLCSGEGVHPLAARWLRAGPSKQTLDSMLEEAKALLAEPVHAEFFEPKH